MKTITIEITDTEYSAMEYAALSPEDWSDNAVKNRARIAIDEIVQLYTSTALDAGVQIPTTREEIVADAFARGWVKTAAQVNAETDIPV